MTHEKNYFGNLVKVKNAPEILATPGALGGLPFLPEILVHCGLRFTGDRDTVIDIGGGRCALTLLKSVVSADHHSICR